MAVARVSIEWGIGKAPPRLGMEVVLVNGVEFLPGDFVPAELSGLRFSAPADELLGILMGRYILQNDHFLTMALRERDIRLKQGLVSGAPGVLGVSLPVVNRVGKALPDS